MYILIDTSMQNGQILGEAGTSYRCFKDAVAALRELARAEWVIWQGPPTEPGTPIRFADERYEHLAELESLMECERAVIDGLRTRPRRIGRQPHNRRFLALDGRWWKKCTGCGDAKPVDDYYLKNNGDLFSQCKECEKALQRARIAAKSKKS